MLLDLAQSLVPQLAVTLPACIIKRLFTTIIENGVLRMIDLDLTDDHLSVEHLVKEFVSREVAPVIAENDANHYFDIPFFPSLQIWA